MRRLLAWWRSRRCRSTKPDEPYLRCSRRHEGRHWYTSGADGRSSESW